MFEHRTPSLISVVIDAKAQHCLAVLLRPNSPGGVWDAFVQLKYKLSTSGKNRDVISAFYSEQPLRHLFQPEPGCSDPTFAGSTADVSGLIGGALNILLGHRSD